MNWPKKTLEKEREAHFNFFGKEFDLSGFKETLEKYGQVRVEEWKNLLLESHFLPKVEMARKADFPGFKIRPDNHCYETVYRGKVLRMIDGELKPDKKAHWLLGQTVLIDTRLKPAYDNGRRMWQNDNFLGPIIENLRQRGKIKNCEYGPSSSRFEVSDLEWDHQIRPALAQKLNLSSFRLERVAEAVVIPQLYPHMLRRDDGTTNTWVWYEEFFEDRSKRLVGGDSGYGGLADVIWDCYGNHWSGRSFRPLAVL